MPRPRSKVPPLALIKGFVAPTAGSSLAARVLIFSRRANELHTKGGDASIERGPLGSSIGDQNDHPRAYSRSALLVH
jgi:hypothetical protein